MRDEVHRHLNRLNNKWKAVEQSINPTKVKSPSKDSVFHGEFFLFFLFSALIFCNLCSIIEYLATKYKVYIQSV